MNLVERLRDAAKGPYPIYQPEAMFSALCDQAATELDRLLSIEARARLVISEWRSYGGDIKPPIVDQLEALEELLSEDGS